MPSPVAVPPPRRSFWLADIARIATLGGDAVVDAGGLFWLRWEPIEPEPAVEVPPIPEPIREGVSEPVDETSREAPPSWPHIRHLVPESIEHAPEQTAPLELGEAFSDEELSRGDEALARRPDPEPLVPWSVLEAPLGKRLADVGVSARPDVEAAVDRLARGEVLERLPPQIRRSWPSRLCLVVDRSERLRALTWDARNVAQELERLCGPGAVFEPELPVLETHVERAGAADAVMDAIVASVRVGDAVLVVSDLGVDGDANARRAWRSTWAAIREIGARPVALLPVARARWPAWLTDDTALAWGANATGLSAEADVRDDVARLAQLLEVAAVCEPALLRAGRIALCGRRPGVEVELAAAARLRAGVAAVAAKQGGGAAEREERAVACREAEVAAFRHVMRAVHADLPDELKLYEALRWRRSFPAAEGLWESTDVSVWINRLLKTGRAGAGHEPLVGEVERFAGVLTEASTREAYGDEVIGRPLQRLVAWAAARRDDGGVMPEGVDAVALAEAAGPDAARIWRLVHAAGSVWIVPEGVEVAGLPAAHVEVCRVRGDALGFAVGKRGRVRVLDPVRGGRFSLTDADAIDVAIGRGRVRLRRVVMEPWFSAMWRDGEGLHASLKRGPLDVPCDVTWLGQQPEPLELNRGYMMGGKPPPTWMVGGWAGEIVRPAWASTYGVDLVGLWADWTHAGVTQRFRWIPPGRFKMGSPDDDGEAYDDEKPQHDVVLTRGFWLGDTPVTQALWTAVMGKSPSRFRGDSRPVDSGSWDDAQDFCRKANRRVAGLELRLPTEAEWEYACRAGTMAVRYGALDEIAWYGGNAGDGTKPVLGKKPNAFGLYDTLGNVWEWCGDWVGAYEAEAGVDPAGPDAGPNRVLRGGSWNFQARFVRAAFRRALPPGYRWYDAGFRLARGHQAQAPNQAPGPRSQQPAQGQRSGPASGGGVRGPSAAAKPPRTRKSFLDRILDRDPKDDA